MSNQISQYIEKYKNQIHNICLEIETAYHKTGFQGQLLEIQEPVEYSLLKDDLAGEYSLQGVWLYDTGYKQGMLLLHPDGSFIAEYDVVKPHPQKTKWFVEAISVWGKNSTIKSEAKLIPAVE